MAKLSATQQTIVNAFSVYKEGSTAVVRSFEAAIHAFWHTDSCNPATVQFFLNAAKRWPVLQRTAVALLTKKGDEALAYFEIKKSKEGDFVVKNMADITKEMKVKARQNVAKFIAMEYTSLMHEKSIKFDISFDADKAAGSIRNAIMAQVKAMMAAHGDVDEAVIKSLITKATSDALSGESLLKAKVAGQQLKEKAAEAEAKKMNGVTSKAA